MKTLKKISVALAIAGLTMLVASPALAIDIPTIPGISSEEDVPALIVKVIQYVLIFVGLLALLFILIAGLMYITSTGNEDRVKAAKNTAMYAVVGFAVAIVAYVILAWVNSSLLK